MNIKVNEHLLEITKTPVNEQELNITKVYFDFPSSMDGYVKEAYFTFKGNSYKVIILNNECDIPSEVLQEKGTVELGVVAYKVEDETIKRYNPSPVYFETWIGSLKDAENSEEITPTDKEQIEQMLTNINIDGEKEGRITTLTITYKDGTTKELTLEDGKSIEYRWEGTSLGIRQEGQSEYTYVNLQGPQGQPGAINLLIVSQLPPTGVAGTLYFVEKQDSEEKDVYDEYMWVNNDWERVGEKQFVIDLTDYVKNTNYATPSKAGVIKSGYNGLQVDSTNGKTYCDTYTYANYGNVENQRFISKGTLENVITGKGLVSNTDYATGSTAGVIRATTSYRLGVSNGALYAEKVPYNDYGNMWDNAFISKGTLDNVLTATIGDIGSVLDAINGEVI